MGRTVGYIYQTSSGSPPGIPTHVIGRANECHALLEGVRCNSHLDTGSTVSTISRRFFQEYFSTLPLYPLDDNLTVKCARGKCSVMRVTAELADNLAELV